MDAHILSIAPSTLRSSLDDSTKAEYAGDADNYITFLHPGYDDRSRHSVLLRLQAFDRNGGGLHFGTALAACRIVAGNSENGFFTLQRHGPKVDIHHDELLRHKKYYFFNPDVQNEVYPIYRSFADWSFPHDNLPAEWSALDAEDAGDESAPPSASGLTAFVSARDKCCRVSERKGADYFERAHLVPRSEKDWFEASGMEEYNRSRQLSGAWMLDDARNAIALRSDIHTAFDERKFVIVPKQSKWVVQFLGQTNSLGNNFHNTWIRLIGVSSKFLYARFAWTIFHLLSPFLNAHIPRRLLVRLPDGQEISREFTFEEIKPDVPSRSRTPGSRSTSPRKRPITALEERGSASKRVCLNENSIQYTTQIDCSGSTSSNDTATSLPSVFSRGSPPQPSLSPRDWIRSQRPTDPTLYCCNYEKAEAAARAGALGKPVLGGAYLCDQCLGIEYLEDRDKDVE